MRKVFVNKRNNKYYLSWVYDKNAGVLPVDDISEAERSPDGITVKGNSGNTKKIPVADKKYFNMFASALSRVGRKSFSLLEKLFISFIILLSLTVLFFVGASYGAKQVAQVYAKLFNTSSVPKLPNLGINNNEIAHSKNNAFKPVPPGIKNNILPPMTQNSENSVSTSNTTKNSPDNLLPPGM